MSGALLSHLCASHGSVITHTMFEHKVAYKYTWHQDYLRPEVNDQLLLTS